MIKRPRLARRKEPLQEAGKLVQLATRLNQSSCRSEDRFWETKLDAMVSQVLSDHDEASLSGALDKLFNVDAGAYAALIDTIEACSESVNLTTAPPMHAVLIALPVLAWSRFPIPTGKLSSTTMSALSAQVHGHLLSKDARLSLMSYLFSPDQLPQSYSATWALTRQVAACAVSSKDMPVDSDSLPETAAFLSDTRYILGAVAAPLDAPIFRWQEDDITPKEACSQWQLQVHEIFRALFPACAFEPQAPTAYHSALREADRSSRPYAVSASVDFLKTVLGCEADTLQATVGSYYGQQLEEYRIGFGRREAHDVLHGVVWPILDPEDESPEALQQIEALLKLKGLGTISILSQRLPVEFCDDCGTPLFPNPDGEPTHAELPEEASDAMPQRIH